MSKLTLPFKRGNFVEFRNGLINICPVGRSVSQEQRMEFYQVIRLFYDDFWYLSMLKYMYFSFHFKHKQCYKVIYLSIYNTEHTFTYHSHITFWFPTSLIRRRTSEGSWLRHSKQSSQTWDSHSPLGDRFPSTLTQRQHFLSPKNTLKILNWVQFTFLRILKNLTILPSLGICP